MSGTGSRSRSRRRLTATTRPGRTTPGELYDALIGAAGLQPGARLLEVGAGTAKATLPLAERGFEITALELGPRLAEVGRHRLSGFNRVSVVQAPFESWQPQPGDRFDLVFSATAWHWIDPAVGYQLAWRLLRPGGHLAIWAALHVLPDDADPFFAEIQDVYDELGVGEPADRIFARPGSLPSYRRAMEDSGLFKVALAQEFIWVRTYTATEYIALLDTFSSHIDMTQRQRDLLYGEIRRRLAARPGGTVLRHWGAALEVATRLDQVAPGRSGQPAGDGAAT